MTVEEVYPALGQSSLGTVSYEKMYKQSLDDPDKFWREQAHKYLHWFRDFDRVQSGGFEQGDIAWFLNGKLNASVCCLDQHLAKRGDQVAVIWEGDEPGLNRHLTYKELHRLVCKAANVMKRQGVAKGDVVMIYMPMVPEILVAMLACARVGAPHSVVFAGFSSEALKDRIIDAQSKWVFTSDEGKRGGRTIALKQIVDKAIDGLSIVQKVFMFQRTGANVHMVPDRDLRMEEEMMTARPYCPAEMMDSEDTLFILYTSGSTGKPKGVAHTTAGYLLHAAMTHKLVFDYRDGDVYACPMDAGWITGHTYIVYGPLVNGANTVVFESLPTYPDHTRYWDLIQRHKITQFYTAPTAIRALMRFGTDDIGRFDKSTLRILGTVGEPINPEAWRWFYEHVGEGRCSIVDTWWQTETGGHMATPLPGITRMKPGSCTLPFFGVELGLVDPGTGAEVEGNNVEGILVIKRPWPSIARTVYGDHERYLTVYMRPYKGYYFTGDGARRDGDGFYWITGRVDDVLNSSGHRIGTAEVESALVGHHSVSEAAVVGYPHDIKGEGILCYVTLKEGHAEVPELVVSLKNEVRAAIGPFATPDIILFTPALPKTRSGKIMRRILRKIAAGEGDQLGDISTLADPSVVDYLIQALAKKRTNGH